MKKKPTHTKAPRRVGTKMGIAILAAGLTGAVYWGASRNSSPAETPPPAPTKPVASPAEGVPPFHQTAEAARPLPATLPPAYFRNPQVARAYRAAQQIPAVLAQQPCYCYCDRYGHGSLLDCYKDDHGAG